MANISNSQRYKFRCPPINDWTKSNWQVRLAGWTLGQMEVVRNRILVERLA